MKRLFMPILMMAALLGITASITEAGPVRQAIQARRTAATPSATIAPPTVELIASAAVPENAQAAAIGQGRIFHEFVRLKVAASLRKQGYGIRDARELSQSLTDNMIDSAAKATNIPAAIGDGKLLQAIIDFFKSPQGQALLDALLKLLLGMLLVDHQPAPIGFELDYHYALVFPESPGFTRVFSIIRH